MTDKNGSISAQKKRRYGRTRVGLVAIAVIFVAWSGSVVLSLVDAQLVDKMRCHGGTNCAVHGSVVLLLAKTAWALGAFALFGWPFFLLALFIALAFTLLMFSVDVVTIRAGTRSRMLTIYEWTAWVVIFGVAGYALQRYYGPVSALIGFGGSSGQIANLQFRLQDQFPVTSVAWSSDGRYIATGSTMDRRIDIWDMSSRKIVKVLLRKFPPASFHEISWSPSGQYLAFCDAPGVLRLYRTGDWTEAHVFSGPPGDAGCTQSSFSSDSGQVALLAAHFLGVYSVPDWQTLMALNLNVGWSRGDFFNAVVYLPNTHTVLVGGGQYEKQGNWDGRVWFFASGDPAPGRSIGVYRADRGGPVLSLAVDPDSLFIATGAKTGAGNQYIGFTTESVHILNALNGSLAAAPLDNLPPLKFGSDEGLAYTHDGRYIIVAHGGEEGWIHVLDGRKFGVIDLVHSDEFSYDVAVNQVNDDFAVGANNQVIVWSLPER